MTKAPVFGFLACTAGTDEGAVVRDMRLANALHRRGYKVVVYWFMETNPALVSPGIKQRHFLHGARYLRNKPSTFMEMLGRMFNLAARNWREGVLRRHPDLLGKLQGNLVASMCDSTDDPVPSMRLERLMARDGVTHLLPTFVMVCPIALAAKERGRHPFDYLATFQGEEIFANYAHDRDRLSDYYAMLRRCVEGSSWPAIAVSKDYAMRIQQEMGIDATRLTSIYPGIELPPDQTKPAFSLLEEKLPGINSKLPIVSYLGRQETEKGIDLLLYAARMLNDRGVQFQLVICGTTGCGRKYHDVCKKIADHLRLGVFWKRRVSDEFRAALYAYSRCVVYPSIHREPFGLVAAEAMSQGTPVIVPDHGGVAEVIGNGDGVAGLTFKVWDSRDLADQIGRISTDDVLYARLTANTRRRAATFDVEAMTDRLLRHMGIDQEANHLQKSAMNSLES